MTPEQIKQIQDQLRAAGFDPGPSDGVLGPHTAQAVQGYQQSRGLTVDGVIGPQTQGALSSNAPAKGGAAAPAASVPATTVPSPASDPTYTGINWTDPSTIPFLSSYLNIPDLAAVLKRAHDAALTPGGQWDQQRFETEIQSTHWWQSTSEQSRVFQTLPPGQRDALIAQQAALIWDQVNTLYGRGFQQQNPDYATETSPAIMQMATDVASGKKTFQQAQAEMKQDAQTNTGSKIFQDQFAQVKNITQGWGMNVDNQIAQGVTMGMSNDQIIQSIRKSADYAARFPGQAARAAQNLPRLTEDAYLNLESGYQQALRNYGVDPTQFDSTHMGQLISNDISGTEFSDRLSYLNTVSTTFGPQMRQMFEQHAGMKVSDADLYKMFHGMAPNLVEQYSQITGTDSVGNAQLKTALDQANQDEKANFHHLSKDSAANIAEITTPDNKATF